MMWILFWVFCFALGMLIDDLVFRAEQESSREDWE